MKRKSKDADSKSIYNLKSGFHNQRLGCFPLFVFFSVGTMVAKIGLSTGKGPKSNLMSFQV